MSTVIKEKPGTIKKDEKAKGNINEEQIAKRAYELWLDRGCEHGHDIEDWKQAEDELRRTS